MVAKIRSVKFSFLLSIVKTTCSAGYTTKGLFILLNSSKKLQNGEDLKHKRENRNTLKRFDEVIDALCSAFLVKKKNSVVYLQKLLYGHGKLQLIEGA